MEDRGGEPGAEKVLLFSGSAPVLALDSNALRVLLRLGFGLPKIGRVLSVLLRYALFFFTGPFSSLGCGSPSSPPLISLRSWSMRSSRRCRQR